MKEFQKSAVLAILLLLSPFVFAQDEMDVKESPTKATSQQDEEVIVEPTTEDSEAAAEAAEEEEDRKNSDESDEKQRVYGWKEWIEVGSKADRMRAKLDSGARTSSLHAEGIEEFERDGRKWVKFAITNPRDDEFGQVTIKAPVERTARVKNTDDTIEKRYVVELNFTIGERQMREEFTLNDRSSMVCPVLIGRNALRHLGLLDCSRVDLAEKKILK